jgi:hypothetical protein
MALNHEIPRATHDNRAVKILAKSLHRELLEGGYGTHEVMALASELLALVATGVRRESEVRSEATTS